MHDTLDEGAGGFGATGGRAGEPTGTARHGCGAGSPGELAGSESAEATEDESDEAAERGD